MRYNRTISVPFSQLLGDGGALRWLFDFVKKNDDLDLFIGKYKSKEWLSIYRGLTRFLFMSPTTHNAQKINIRADRKYIDMLPSLYGEKEINDNFQNDIEKLIVLIENDSRFDRYYNNKKEGFYQNKLSRKYGICGNPGDDFVIIDKEVVVGFSDQKEKDSILGKIQQKYKQLQKEISDCDPIRYGKNLEKKAIGNELDFLALDKEGNILLIEYKHGTNTSGIYLSPLQIGMYYGIFNTLPKKDLGDAVFKMLEQKQKIGLINSKWERPAVIKDIIPVLIISEYNYKSSAKIKFDEILQFTRNQHGTDFLGKIKCYNFTMESDLSTW